MAYTEFYTDATNGSNLNSGSDAGTSVYTSTNGGWNSGTGVFTPTDGSNPATASPGVTVGQFASVYIDGATVGVFVGRVTNVTNAVNGTITVSTTAKFGTAPTTNASARTIKVGGCWKGPNAAEFFPFNVSGLGGAVNSSSDQVCVNMKNNASYAVTSAATFSGVAGARIQGYTGSVRDGGKAILTSNVTGSTNFNITGGMATWVDLIWVSTGGSGSSNLTSVGSTNGSAFIRNVFHGSRGAGLAQTSGPFSCHECEAYDNNKSNTSSLAGFNDASTAGSYYSYCYSHDNTGSNTAGFIASGSGTTVTYDNCISETNGGIGISLTGGASVKINNCDLYNNGSDGINSGMTQNASSLIIQNCNFVKNTGKGINVTVNSASGMVANNGYGSGTQANGSADSLKSLYDFGTSITYASGVTPWVDPANEDFNINLSAANFAGRGAFVETDGTSSVTVGHPDIGAAQSLTGPGGTFNKEVSYGFA